MKTFDAALQVFDLERIVDDSGTLYVGELSARGLPPIHRVAFIINVPVTGARGGHAHKRQGEYLICVRGGVAVRLESRGVRSLIALRKPGRTLYLPPGYWRDLVDFAPDTVLALLADQPFDPDDYLHDRNAFLAWEAAHG